MMCACIVYRGKWGVRHFYLLPSSRSNRGQCERLADYSHDILYRYILLCIVYMEKGKIKSNMRSTCHPVA